MTMQQTDRSTVTLRGTVLGAGRPAICVPVTGSTVQALADQTTAAAAERPDVLELRIDHLAAVEDLDAVRTAIATVRAGLPSDVPLLFTYRTAREGGAHDRATADGTGLPEAAYEDLVRTAIDSGQVDAVDVEMFVGRDLVDRLVTTAHEHDVAVVMSTHDFTATPAREEIVRRLRDQQAMGADVVKLAAMPHDSADVLTLLQATHDYTQGGSRHAEPPRPAITMAMGPIGVVSRLTGETFGSCLTFGSVGDASAPGQVPVAALRQALDVVHDAQA